MIVAATTPLAVAVPALSLGLAVLSLLVALLALRTSNEAVRQVTGRVDAQADDIGKEQEKLAGEGLIEPPPDA